MRWYPNKNTLKGKDVFIIGGGPSLRGFFWHLLSDVQTIGCNTAFRFGGQICNLCLFGDLAFFEKYKRDLEQYDGTLVTNHPSLLPTPVEWIKTMKRSQRGLSTSPEVLAWNGNTGCAAINLALLLGAKRVLLLGFDGKDDEGTNNWHTESVFKYKPEVHERFATGFQLIANTYEKAFPGTQIINLNRGSALDMFEFGDLEEFIPALKPHSDKPKKKRAKKKKASDATNNT